MLFRKEVMEARRNGWLGGISLAQPVRFRLIAWAAVAIAIAILLLLVFGSYTRRSHVEGRLQPVQGLATVVAPTAGVVTSIGAGEGANVDAGQALASVAIPRTIRTAGDAGAALSEQLARRRDGLVDAKNARTDAFDARRRGLDAQLVNAAQELRRIEAALEIQREQVRIAEDNLARFRQLRDQRYVSALQLQNQESNALQQQSGLQSLLRQLATMQRQIAELRQSRDELPAELRTADAEFERDIASVEQEAIEIEARQALTVVSPLDGVIATQHVKPGQSVEAGQPLMTVIPGKGELEVELFVPSRAVGFVEPGDSVLLRYHAYPFQKFGHHTGRVVRISRSVLGEEETGTRGSEPSYRVVVALDRQTVSAYGREERLKPGMTLEADILGERRSLIEWVFEPLYSIRGDVAGR
ncbi:MAG: HlyD family secretion protein [Pseudomonadota bacterium]